VFDLNELKTYREGNRLEAKKALGRDGQGELPRSVWETLSAFANTAGGVIVLGVTERRDDGSFVVHGIPKVGKVLDDFWNAALSEDKISARFMKDSDATLETVEGKDIIVIRVPWVDRHMRPIFINDSIFGGTFRRTHAGDHQCKREEVLSMLRDSDTSSQDAAIAESARVEFINRETVAAYRRRFDQRNEATRGARPTTRSSSPTSGLCAWTRRASYVRHAGGLAHVRRGPLDHLRVPALLPGLPPGGWGRRALGGPLHQPAGRLDGQRIRLLLPRVQQT